MLILICIAATLICFDLVLRFEHAVPRKQSKEAIASPLQILLFTCDEASVGA